MLNQILVFESLNQFLTCIFKNNRPYLSGKLVVYYFIFDRLIWHKTKNQDSVIEWKFSRRVFKKQ